MSGDWLIANIYSSKQLKGSQAMSVAQELSVVLSIICLNYKIRDKSFCEKKMEEDNFINYLL